MTDPTVFGAEEDEDRGRGSPLSDYDAALLRAEIEAVGTSPPPPLPRRGLGTVLRTLTGVDEGLLAHVPPERAKYTKLGVVILGTAAIATFSMWLALAEVLDEVSWISLLPAVGWGIFIANLDSWLVSSLHGTRWRNRIWMVLPRLAISVLFGIIIAEPLVLRIFNTAVEQQIDDTRQDEVTRYGALLVRCNPTDGSKLAAADAKVCGDSILKIRESTPDALNQQLKRAQGRRKLLAHQIAVINKQQQHLDKIARQECNGVKGAGLSGRVGEGPNCEIDRDKADRYAADSRVAVKQKRLDTLVAHIGTLEGQVKDQAKKYKEAVADTIQDKVTARAGHRGKKGLLERLEALADLAGRHWHIAAAAWLLRLLFITLDCLPMLVKIMGGSGSYDHLVDDELGTAERVHREEKRTEEARRTGRLKLIQYRLEREAQSAREAFDSEMRMRHAAEEVALDAHIDQLTEKLLRGQARAPGDDDVAGAPA